MIDITELPGVYVAYRNRYLERDERMCTLDDVVKGDFSVFDDADEEIKSRSPNLIQVALEDTAEAASLMPTLRVVPGSTAEKAKKSASKMEKIGAGYFDLSKMDLLVPQTVMDMAGFGYSVWTVTPNFETRAPVIEKRDPRTAYPEPGWRPGDSVRRCMFVRVLQLSQLPQDWRTKVEETIYSPRPGALPLSSTSDPEVTLVEWFDEDEILIGALYQGKSTYAAGVGQQAVFLPTELERIPNKTGICPVAIGSRFTLDGEFRGQFDQVIGVLEAHVRLMGMVLDYADQAVYSDVWVRDLIGEMPFGGGAYIELGPNGAIGRVPPAVTSLNVQQDLDNLVEGIHVGGRWPRSRPGEVEQSIASAKFIEAAAGMMNTAIRTYHTLLKHMMESALRIAFLVDKAYFPGTKTAAGVLRNQEFLEEYNTSDIDPKNRVRVEYGLGLGRDPAQSAVLMLQYAQNGYISEEFVQENIDGLTDVDRERRRLDTQQFRKMALARLLMKLEAGELPDEALIAIARGREKGEDIFELYEKYVVAPQKQNLEQGLPSLEGLLPPGAPGQPPMPGPGGPQGSMPMPPPAPANPLEGISRLSLPMGEGSFMGTQMTS